MRVQWTELRYLDDKAPPVETRFVGLAFCSHYTRFGAALMVACDDGRVREVLASNCVVVPEVSKPQ